jgi:hypothetical protein
MRFKRVAAALRGTDPVYYSVLDTDIMGSTLAV